VEIIFVDVLLLSIVTGCPPILLTLVRRFRALVIQSKGGIPVCIFGGLLTNTSLLIVIF
jgi:hypothetical protein